MASFFSNAVKSFQSNIASNYIISPDPVSSCGPWKIYDAKRKKGGQPYSVFVFDRKSLSTTSDSGLTLGSRRGGDDSRAAKDEVVERLKREASMLARLRHPSVLELVEPVEDTRSGGLQFATEPVVGSLSIVLREKDEEERAGGGRYISDSEGRRRRREVEIDELEIQKGLLQLGKALEFLHESANLIHGNLTPDAVVVNAKSDWKICGLGFAVSTNTPPMPPQFDTRLPANVQLSLDYAAPDMVLDNTPSASCDLFSLGVLIVTLYNHPHKSPIETHNSNSSYRRLLTSPQSTPSGSNNFLSSRPLPRDLIDSVLPALITRRPATRLTARAFQESSYFDNILVSTLRFLDSLPAKTPSEKAAFMRGLPKVLPQFPRSVLEKKILPGLVEELRDGSMLALVLPNIFQISESGSARLFSEKVLKRLKEVFVTASTAGHSEPKTAAAKVAEREREAGKEGGLIVLLNRIGLIKEKTTAQEFKEDVLPLLFVAMESPTSSVQDLALRSIPIALPALDFPTLKNDLFPVVAQVFTKTASLGIKIRGLEAFRVLCGGLNDEDASDGLDGGGKKKEEAPSLDKYTIQEKVIPLLKGIKTKEPAVMMETLKVFARIGMGCDREVVACDILPALWGMSFGPLLGLEQFQAFMTTIKSLSSKIESEQTRKLSELSATNAAASTSDFLTFSNGAARASSPGVGETDFEALVFGRNQSQGAASLDWGAPAPSPKPAQGRSTPAQVASPQFSWSSTPKPTSPPASGGTQPLQPGMGFSSTTALRPSPSPQPPPKQGIDWTAASKPKPTFPTPTPAQRTQSSSSSAFPTMQPTRPALQSASSSGSTTILYGQTRQSSSPVVTGGVGEFRGFGIAPPPAQKGAAASGGLQGLQMGAAGGGFGQAGGMGGMGQMGGMNSMNAMSNGGSMNMAGMGMNIGMGMGMGAPLQPQKQVQEPNKEAQGLDKWESLL